MTLVLIDLIGLHLKIILLAQKLLFYTNQEIYYMFVKHKWGALKILLYGK